MTGKRLERSIHISVMLLFSLIITVGIYSSTTAQGSESSINLWAEVFYRHSVKPLPVAGISDVTEMTDLVGADIDTTSNFKAGNETGWVIECVDCPKNFGFMSDRTLRLDADNHPRIAYGGDHLYYAWHDGMTWQYETIDTSGGVGFYVSLAIDGNGFPHVSYCSVGWSTYPPTCDNLRYAYKDTTGWHIEIVDDSGPKGVYTAIDIDDNGYPHIGYIGCYDDFCKLIYTHKDAQGWHNLILSEWDYWGGGISLSLDAYGYPQIVYKTVISLSNIQGEDPPSYQTRLDYAYFDNQGWHFETVDTINAIGEFSVGDTSLVLDSDGFPYIGYTDLYGSGVNYAYKDALGWHTERVDIDGVSPSISLDIMGFPHVSYRDDYHGYMKYAYRDNYIWNIQAVGNCEAPSIAMDGDGHPHISCFDHTNNDLDYYFLVSSGWQMEIIDSMGIILSYTSLALDIEGYPHISYCNYRNRELIYAKQDASGWQIQVVDFFLESSPYDLSLALDNLGSPHISYHDPYPNNDLKYAYRDFYGWHIHTIDSEGNVGWNNSLALDSNGFPHISYLKYDTYNTSILYIYQDEQGWHRITIDTEGAVGATSLVLDRSGFPHITYQGHDGVLNYAYQDTDGWHIEAVVNDVWSQSSLELDKNGYPHISYLGIYNQDLKYAYQDALGWHIQTVDGSGSVGADNSLTLDGFGYPHISYYDETNGNLNYAYQDALGWHIHRADTDGISTGIGTSIALDKNDYPHISYIDGQNYDLKYAYHPSEFIYFYSFLPLSFWGK